MSIMQRCCCCGVRSGSTASAIYSLIISILGGAVFTCNLVLIIQPELKEALNEAKIENPTIAGDLDVNAYICAQTVSFVFALIFLVSVFFTSILVIVGISKDSKDMLVPFMAAKGIGLIWYMYAFAVNIYSYSAFGMEYAGFSVLGFVILLGPFLAADVVCLLCVISQYQEYRDGRGRLCDAGMIAQTTMVIHQQQLPSGSGAFAYQHMQGAPPSYFPPLAPVKDMPGAI